MKNKSTIARLLAEEDIFVVNKVMDTAYFNIKTRELGLPIWKEEISNDEVELMTCHEIGHALWTSMDMMDKSRERKLNHSFVNILEDARIEKFVQSKYPGSVNLFKKGYKALAARDFFGIGDGNVNDLNLIDRINLYFKMMPGVEFSENEDVFVNRAERLETEDEVLDLAEDLYKFMEENSKDDKNSKTDGSGDGDGDDDGNNGDDGDDGNDSSDAKSSDETDNTSDEKKVGEESSDGEKSSDADSEDSPIGDTSKENDIESKTDNALNEGLKSLADENAIATSYARIPKVNSEDYIVDYKTALSECKTHYDANGDGSNWVNYSLNEVKEFKNNSKKTVSYMVKEFEMKKSADQYARASTSKTGSLDMGSLHTYKYNEDLFKKITTLPGATNHGMVMVLDWSGSMQDNIKGTVEQLFQLIMFCRRIKIPFEVFAFTNGYYSSYDDDGDGYNVAKEKAKYGEIIINHTTSLLNFFSSKMTPAEEEKMMHYVWMMAKRFAGTYEDWSITGMPIRWPNKYTLAQTPLNDSIIIMMDFLSKYKKSTRVQKLNTIFLTDGISNPLLGVKASNNKVDGDDYDYIERINNQTVLVDTVTNRKYEINGFTETLITICKDRISDMNIIGFFLAGRGRNGSIQNNTWWQILQGSKITVDQAKATMKKEKVVAIESKGYDQYFILPGGGGLTIDNEGLDDELIGASKAKLKSAFAKSNKNRIQSRVLLNKFVKLVA